MITVSRRPISGKPWLGLLGFDGKTYPCALGRSGITTRKREGDGATPAGCFRLLYGFFRKDRLLLPPSPLPMVPIEALDGWCDEPTHPAYNCPVSLPFTASHEKMMRDDRLYDVCIVLDYNIDPRQRGKGSAIFFHLTRSDMGPTEGCVAIDPDVMRKLLPSFGTNTLMQVIT